MRRHSNSTVFNLLILCLGIFLSADYFQPTVLASPIAEVNSLELRDLVKRYSGTPSGKLGNGGPADSDYPSDDEINQAYTAPSGPFVFYSGIGSSEEPYEFAKSLDNGAVILRGAFTKGYITQGSPKKSKEWFQDFLDRVSGFYADKAIEAGNTVYFVGRFDASVAACSVWSRIELPTLTAGGIKITLVDYSNFDNKKDYPLDLPNSPIDYPGIPPREVHGGLVRRQDYCFDWQGDHEDPADPDSDPQIGLDYYPGNCGVHLQQYQKSEGQATSNGNGATSHYRFTIQLKDDQQEDMGGVDYYDAPGGQGVDVTSALPLVFIATAGNVDDDPVSFAYGSQSWKSSDGQCSVGGYDKGSRQMDCGFSC